MVGGSSAVRVVRSLHPPSCTRLVGLCIVNVKDVSNYPAISWCIMQCMECVERR